MPSVLTDRPSILCVDDDLQILDALERDLRQDFIVHRASSLQDAEKKLSDPFDIILCDFHIGLENGLDWLKSLQTLQNESARVLITGQLDWEIFSSALETGVIQRLVSKPWDPLALRLQMKEAQQSYKLLRQNKSLAQLALNDTVTNLANRRHFEDVLNVELARAKRHGRTLSLAMIDVDHFKHFNDEHGHAAGDLVLREIAVCLKASVRVVDLVARYGGDEFVILMPDTTTTAARVAAERVHEEIIISTRATISLGLADSTRHATAADLIAAADRALYAAKAAGRNQIIVV